MCVCMCMWCLLLVCSNACVKLYVYCATQYYVQTLFCALLVYMCPECVCVFTDGVIDGLLCSCFVC